MKLGQAAMDALRAQITGLLKPGEELVVAGAIALEGTGILAEKKREELLVYFSENFLWNVRSLRENYGDRNGELAELARSYGADAMYEISEGGILAGLWKMAEASQVGLEADLREIPVRQETIEICERMDVNPYKLFSGGCLIAGMKNGTAFVRECRRRGYPAQIIGETNNGNDRLLYSSEHARYLERPARDELWNYVTEDERIELECRS